MAPSLYSTGTAVVLESEMAGTQLRCTEAGLRRVSSLQETFTYPLIRSGPVTGLGFVGHNSFALALGADVAVLS